MESDVFSETKALAENGDGKAQYELGLYYYHNEGIKQNYSRVEVQYFDKNNLDELEARSLLYSISRDGSGKDGAQNYELAIKWFLEAAKKDHIEAQYNAAAMYYNGEGAYYDHSKCIELLEKSAAQGFAPAQEALLRLNAN